MCLVKGVELTFTNEYHKNFFEKYVKVLPFFEKIRYNVFVLGVRMML